MPMMKGMTQALAIATRITMLKHLLTIQMQPAEAMKEKKGELSIMCSFYI